MKYSFSIATALFTALAALPLSAETINLVQKSSGKSLSATYLEQTETGVTIRTLAGNTSTILFSQLTEETVAAIKKLAVVPELEEGSKELFESVNKAAGHPLFATTDLWKEEAATIAKRLNWRTESKKDNISSYRNYTEQSYKLFGAHPYCVSLYGGDNDTPESFSLVYANKGDFGSTFGIGEDHFKKLHPNVELPVTLDEAIEADEAFITASLTSALGEPKKQYYGEKEDKRSVQRWDAGDHAFLLSALDGDYVHLLIVPTSNADLEGKVKFIKDTDLKKIQLTNIRKEENGDVWIDNIPMVNQGPKGYCAPATFERAMRYMHVPADMYLLATASTQEGTSLKKITDDCKRIVRSKARRIKDLDLVKDLKIRVVKKYIDKGVPLLWSMRSLKEYNQVANKRTKQRAEISDLSAWTKEIADEAKELEGSLGEESNHHICLIIGYNEETNEIAVSDSWGPAYEIRWIHADIAKEISYGTSLVFDF